MSPSAAWEPSFECETTAVTELRVFRSQACPSGPRSKSFQFSGDQRKALVTENFQHYPIIVSVLPKRVIELTVKEKSNFLISLSCQSRPRSFCEPLLPFSPILGITRELRPRLSFLVTASKSVGNRRSQNPSLIINEIYRLYILLETALKSTSCATVIFSSSNIREFQQNQSTIMRLSSASRYKETHTTALRNILGFRCRSGDACENLMVQDSDGYTTLHLAACDGNVEVLLKANAVSGAVINLDRRRNRSDSCDFEPGRCSGIYRIG
jgi:hypothetical protein